MNRRGRVLAGLSLIAVAILALHHPMLAAVILVAAGLGSLALAVRRRGDEVQGAVSAPPAPHRIGRILVPVDFSPEAARALDYARTLADRFCGQVFVLHVLPPHRGLFGRWATGEEREALWRARVEMQAFLGAFGAAGCRAVFAAGTPFAVILGEAGRLRADLIVLGPRGTGGTECAVLGRTAAEVVRRAHVPVLTVVGTRAEAREGAAAQAEAA